MAGISDTNGLRPEGKAPPHSQIEKNEPALSQRPANGTVADSYTPPATAKDDGPDSPPRGATLWAADANAARHAASASGGIASPPSHGSDDSGDSHAIPEGYIPLSDAVAFFETAKTYRLADIRDRYRELSQEGLDAQLVADLLTRRFDVRPSQLEHEITRQNPDPNRSIVELTSNAIDAMEGFSGDVKVRIDDGAYEVMDTGAGMGAEELFERLLIPQLSGKSGKDTIGRFGIGFFTALAHLNDGDSRVIVETKKQGEPGIRVEFVRLNGELGFRVGPFADTESGTRVQVIDARIREGEVRGALEENIGFVLHRSVVADGKPINQIDPSRVSNVGNGKLFISERRGSRGRAVITVGGVKIEEFETRGQDVPDLIVFDLPLSTKLPESRNQIRVDQGVAEQFKAFIDHAQQMPDDAAKLAYLNAIAPLLQELQRRNELHYQGSDLVIYATQKVASIVGTRKSLPDDPIYASVAQGETVRVNSAYLPRSWASGYERPLEWRGAAPVILMDFAHGSRSGIIADQGQNLIVLDRALYEAHRHAPVGLEVLASLLPEQMRGTWIWTDRNDAPVQADAMATAAASRVIDRYPLFVRQRHGLEELARQDPSIIELIARMPDIMVRHPMRAIVWNVVDDLWIADSKPKRGWRVLRADGAPVFEGVFHWINPLGDGLLEVKDTKDGPGRVLRIDGTPAFEGEFDFIWPIGNGLLIVKTTEDAPNRVIHTDGTPAFEGKSNRISPLKNGLLAAEMRGGLIRVLRPDGTPAFAGEFGYLEPIGKGLLLVMYAETGLWSVIRTDGSPAFKESYDYLTSIGNGLLGAQRKRNDLYRVIRAEDGEPAFAGEFYDAASLGPGLMKVRMTEQSQWRVIRTDGTPAVDGEFYEVESLGNGLLKVTTSARGKWRALHVDGRPTFDSDCAHINEFGDGDGLLHVWRSSGNLGSLIMRADGTPVISIDACYAGSTREHFIFHVHDVPFTPLKLDTLLSAHARRNLEKLLSPVSDAVLYHDALALVGFSNEDFDFALSLLPHAKQGMLFGEPLLAALRKMHERGGYSLQTVAALFDIGHALGWEEAPPAQTIEKFETLIERLSSEELFSLRDAAVDNDDLRFIVKKGEWSRLASFPPKTRGYLYYLAIDEAELFEARSSEIGALEQGQTFSLSALNAAVRSWGSAWRSFQGTADEAKERIDEQLHREGVPADLEVSRSRMRHAMYHLGDGQGHLFIRELIQNSIDASRDEAHGKGSLDIESFEEDGAHVLRIADTVGMGLNQVINNLLLVGESTKGEGALGKFGVGFFTIYPGAKEIRIKTGRGDGKVACMHLRPVYHDGEVKDVEVSYRIDSENYKGTVIERVSLGTIPALEAAMARSAAAFARFVDPEIIEVSYNRRAVNQGLAPFAQEFVPGVGKVRLFRASESAFAVGGLFVKPLSEEFLQGLPQTIREEVKRRGLVLDLPAEVGLVRSRNDFVNPGAVENALIQAASKMLIQDYASRWSQGEIEIKNFPHDYFSDHHSRFTPLWIERDAERIKAGHGPLDASRYCDDDRGFAQLLTLLPCLQVGDEVISLEELRSRVLDGRSIDSDRLPWEIRDILKKCEAQNQNKQSEREALTRIEKDLNLSGPHRLERSWSRGEACRPEALSYDALLEIAAWLAGRVEPKTQLHWSTKRPGSRAHASCGTHDIFFSILNNEGMALKVSKLLKASSYVSWAMHYVTREMIEIVTHELTHALLENYGEWTHDPRFHEQQRELLTTLLRAGPLEPEQRWGQLQTRYPEPTFLPAADYLRLLVTGDLGGGETGSAPASGDCVPAGTEEAGTSNNALAYGANPLEDSLAVPASDQAVTGANMLFAAAIAPKGLAIP